MVGRPTILRLEFPGGVKSGIRPKPNGMSTSDRPAGERRPAAIMFTDVAGFSALSRCHEATALQDPDSSTGSPGTHTGDYRC